MSVRFINGSKVAYINDVARTLVEGWPDAGEYKICAVVEEVCAAL